MQSIRGGSGRAARVLLALLVFVGAVAGIVGAAHAAPASGSNVTWRNEGFSAEKGWTTGEIGPYEEGALVPFRFTVTNPSSTKPAVVGGFAVQVTHQRHGVAVFDSTSEWTGPLDPSTKDGLADDMLRTTFPAGLTLAPGASATFSFKARLATSAPGMPAAGMLNGNGVCGFSELDADGVGSFGKRVPVKVEARTGYLGTPAIDLVTTSDAPVAGVRSGTEVTFTYAITNIGDVALYNAVVTDAQLGVVGTAAGPLAPGESAMFTATRVLTETIANSATAVAVDQWGREATDTEEFTASVLSSARLFGSVYEDADINGAWDAGEIGLAGWVVELRDAQGAPVAVTLTDVAGAYVFEGVDPGQAYTIAVVTPDAWIVTAPVDGVFTVTPAPGQDAGPFDFGAVLDFEV